MEKQSKFKQWKQALRQVPPERLLKINMQGYVLQTFGIIFVSIMLLLRGLWYIIFALIFVTWNNVAGFIAAYQQLKQIEELKKQLNIPEPEDKSPHRKKTKIIKETMGAIPGWVSAGLSVLGSFLIINPLGAVWYMKVAYFGLVVVFYYICYFYIMYFVAKLIKSKEVKNNATEEEQSSVEDSSDNLYNSNSC